MIIHCLNCGDEERVFAGSKDRICPVCSYELYQDLYRKYEKILPYFHNLKLLTLTWRPVKEQSAEEAKMRGVRSWCAHTHN